MLRAPAVWTTALLAASALALALPGRAQDAAAPRDLATVLEPIRQARNVPALGGAVVRSGGPVSLGVSGVRVAGGSVRVTRDDLWHIGSNTKAMTATLLARLHDKQVVSLDTEVTAAFDGLEADAGWAGATVRRLLAHRGGAPDELTSLPVWGRLWRHEGSPFSARRLLVTELLAQAPEQPPGTAYVYSNAGYAIAGHVAETKGADGFESLLSREVFRPLRMQTAGFGAPGESTDRAAPDQPWGHARTGGTLQAVPPGPRGDNPPGIAPAGRVHLSLADWARFAAAHLRGARGAGNEFLEAATFRALHTPVATQSYALGWVVTTRPWGPRERSVRVLTHDGSNTLWYASIWLVPDRDAAFLAVCNAGGEAGTRACHDVIRALSTDTLR